MYIIFYLKKFSEHISNYFSDFRIYIFSFKKSYIIVLDVILIKIYNYFIFLKIKLFLIKDFYVYKFNILVIIIL